jgi:hypothetical protein
MLVDQARTVAGEIDWLGRKAKRRADPEAALQRAIIKRGQWLGVMVVHVRNEGKRSVAGHIMAKANGLRPGFPDLICLGPDRQVCFLEAKEPGWEPPRPTNKREYAHYLRQCECHDEVQRRGFLARFVTCQDQAEAAWREAGLIA